MHNRKFLPLLVSHNLVLQVSQCIDLRLGAAGVREFDERGRDRGPAHVAERDVEDAIERPKRDLRVMRVWHGNG
jgi:hypothetical protein